MSFKSRLLRLEKAVGKASCRRRDCRGLDSDEIWTRFESAMPEGCDEFDAVIGEYQKQWAEKGCDPQSFPGFYIWFRGLQEGWLHLPEKIPLPVLRAFVELLPKNTPLQRCEDCRLGLPANSSNVWRRCPACDSQRIYWADFNKPWGTYRPQEELWKPLKVCKPDQCFLDEAITYLGSVVKPRPLD